MNTKRLLSVAGLAATLGLMIYVFVNRSSIPEYVTEKDYNHVMTSIQEGLLKRGYKIEKIQPIDQGLAKAGLKIQKYRVIFYHPKQSIELIQKKYPKFSALLPLSITIAKDKDKLKIIDMPYRILYENAKQKDLISQIKLWEKDSKEIIKNAL